MIVCGMVSDKDESNRIMSLRGAKRPSNLPGCRAVIAAAPSGLAMS